MTKSADPDEMLCPPVLTASQTWCLILVWECNYFHTLYIEAGNAPMILGIQ